MKKCAYCDKSNIDITKEHVVNKEFLKRFFKNGSGYAKYYDKTTSNFLTVKDVCSICNNGLLSQFDTYFLEFYDANLPRFRISPSTKIQIQYDYNKLSKWLLKTIYNSERKHSYEQVQNKMYRYKNYILGKDKRQKLFKIYVELLSDVPEEEIREHTELPEDFNGKIDMLKIGTVVLREEVNSKDKNITKYLLSSNFMFHVFLIDPGKQSDSFFKPRLENYIQKSRKSKLFLLNPKEVSLELLGSGRTIIDIAKDSMEGTQTFVERNKKS